MSEVVTGEAVQLDLRAATFASRAISGVLDLAVQGVVLVALLVVSSRLADGVDAAASAALTLTLVVLVAVGLPTGIETLTRGRTLGKLALGLRTVRDDAGPIRLRHALIRALVGFVEIWLLLGAPALICSLASPTGKRLGDLVAGTYVVRERGAVKAAPMAELPPQLRGWAGNADIGRLPDGMALSVRQFLGRAPSLHPQSRAALGLQLARSVAPYVAPPPPAGTHPETFLAALLVERRHRDTRRLAREQAARERLAGVDSVDAALARVSEPTQHLSHEVSSPGPGQRT